MFESINFQQEVLGIPLGRITISFLILLATFVFRKIFDSIISKQIRKLSEKTKIKYDDIIVNSIIPPINALIIVIGCFYAISILKLNFIEGVDFKDFLLKSYKTAFAVIGVWCFFRLTELFVEIIKNLIEKSSADTELAHQFTPMLRQSLRVTIVVLGGILIIQNLGYSVGSLLAGVGIGGLAIALAAQDTLANLFGTVVMLTDKPFKVGDWIEFKGVDGDVESVGFRSVKIRTWAKSLVTIPNKLITSEVIENWSAMPKRRVKMKIGVTYESKPEQVENLVIKIRELLKNSPEVSQDFFLVNFTEFNAYSLDILIYYFTVSTAWAEHLAVRQKINLEIMKLVEELGLSFAFPTQSLYFENELNSVNGSK